MFGNLFDFHPECITFPNDLGFLYGYFPKYISDKYSKKTKLERLNNVLLKPLKRSINKNNTEFSYRNFEKLFFKMFKITDLNKPNQIIKNFCNSFEKEYSRTFYNKKYKYLVIKETSIEIYAQEIYKWFPNSKFIQIVRDPRDNYAALKSGINKYYKLIGEKENEILSSLIFRLLTGLKIGLDNKKKIGDKNYLIVKYEDIVRNPVKNMEKISKFLKIKYDPILIKPTVFGKSTHGNSFDNFRTTKISDYNVGRWKKRINAEEEQIINFYLKNLMKKFNYKVSKQKNIFPVSNFYKWKNYKYYYKNTFK